MSVLRDAKRTIREAMSDVSDVAGDVAESVGGAAKAVGEGYVTYAEGFAKGAALRRYEPEWGGLRESSTAGKVVKTIGELTGSIVAMEGLGAAVGVAAAALGLSGPLVPLASATLGALAYTAAEKSDLSDKGRDSILTIAAASLMGGRQIRKIYKAGKKIMEVSPEAASFVKAVKEGTKEFISSGTPEMITDLKAYRATKGLEKAPVEEVVRKALTDIMSNPKMGAAKYPELTKKMKSFMFDADGKVIQGVANMQVKINNAVDDATKNVLKAKAFEEGNIVKESWEKTLVGRVVDKGKETWRGLTKSFEDPGNAMAKIGHGEGYQLADEGHGVQRKLLAFSEQVVGLTEAKLVGKLRPKDPEAYKQLSRDVNAAIEAFGQGDTATVNKLLKTPLHSETFDTYKFAYNDFWEPHLAEKSIGTIKGGGYVPHAKRVKNILQGELGNNIPEELKAGFLMKRKGEIADWRDDDIVGVYRSYARAVSKKLSFDPLVNYFGKSDKHPELAAFINGVIETPRVKGGFIDSITGIRYKNQVELNHFNALANLPQQETMWARISPEAKVLAKKLTKLEDPKVLEYLNGKFAHQYMDTLPENFKRLAKKNSKLWDMIAHPFETSEGQNWLMSRAGGLAEEMAQGGKVAEVNKLVKGGTSFDKAVAKILSDDDVWKRGIRRGNNLATETQFSMDKGMKGKFFGSAVAEHPFLRPLVQFRRFQIAQMESVFNLLRSKGREVSIIRRGLRDEVNVVDRLNGMRVLRKGMKDGLAKAGKEDRVKMGSIIKELDEDMGFLKDEVKRIEPRELARSVSHIGKMIVKGSAPKLARVWLKWGLMGMMFDKVYTSQQKQGHVATSIAGQVPGLENVRGFDLSTRYYDPKYGLVGMVMSYTPFLGLVDSTLPGRPLTYAIHKALFGKEKKAKKGKSKSTGPRYGVSYNAPRY